MKWVTIFYKFIFHEILLSFRALWMGKHRSIYSGRNVTPFIAYDESTFINIPKPLSRLKICKSQCRGEIFFLSSSHTFTRRHKKESALTKININTHSHGRGKAFFGEILFSDFFRLLCRIRLSLSKFLLSMEISW